MAVGSLPAINYLLNTLYFENIKNFANSASERQNSF